MARAVAPALATVAAPAPADKPDALDSVPVPAQRKVIRNATVTLRVESVETALSGIRAAVQSSAGYVSDESQDQDAVRGPRASLSCRVPADKLDAMLARIKSLGQASDIAIRADDITERYFDLEIRIRNARRLEERLVNLLSRPGNDLGDLLNVERELARVRGELDQLEGRQRFWDHQVAYSTLTITVEGPQAALAADKGGIGQSLKHAVTQAGENFVGFAAASIAAIGWLVPLAAVLAIGFWILIRLWRLVRGRWPVQAPKAAS